MAFNQIKVEGTPPQMNLKYEVFCAGELNKSREKLLIDLNREGSINYYFEGLQLKRRLLNKEKFIQSLSKVGFHNQNQDTIQKIEDQPIFFDFQEIISRYENYLHRFDITTRYDISNIKLNITFDPFVNAGAKKLQDCYVVLIYFGANFIHQWMAERKLFDYLFVNEYEKDREVQFYFPHEQLGTVDQIVRGLRARASSICGYHENVDIEGLEFAMGSNDFIHLKTDLHKELYKQRTNILSVEKFILFHELGHIFYGHLEEAEKWSQSPCTNQYELRNRLRRRREMELEADKFGYDFLIIQTALENKWPLDNFDKHVNCSFNYFNPITDLFTLFQMAQHNKIDFSSEYCEYPSNKNRLIKLLGENNAYMFDMLTNYP